MSKTIWFMEGLSCQGDIIKQVVSYFGNEVTVLASHRDPRNEILGLADFCFLEPKANGDLLSFMAKIIAKHRVDVVHVSNRSKFCEQHRATIESMGVRLVTGAKSVASLELADDKVAFAQRMEEIGLPVVPSLRVRNANELEKLLEAGAFNGQKLCIKPVKGIYGMGFWILDPQAKASACFANPDSRIVQPSVYLSAVKQDWPEEMVLMPYLPGDEYSVDMLVDNGNVLQAVGRCKRDTVQEMFIDGEAVELAKKCAAAMRADGLVNVQTKIDSNGNHQLLEINMRPSGGISYGLVSNINLPSTFVQHTLFVLDQHRIDMMNSRFRSVSVRGHGTVLPIPHIDYSKQCAVGA